ncbi:DUF4352 domain-containing protein [Clostridium sardiniense]|uniref:DUF4352 domain-containing protein n=1 Tax=Clostridium sardiniense TaxID=29369 RepID=A0ABS7KXF6_CLOSR|nr:DUF4352 domain-containing protein [Clostridium sardiniense]MBY0755499.1 DUF4352 domain-containing protein [Clostridium sardiniense]MDQ0462198.1 hypothetical protein [Clostridium sardiniense]
MGKEKKAIFKKWWFWIIIVVVVGGAIGAGSNTAENGDTPVANQGQKEDANKKEEANKTETFKIGDTIEVKDFKIKVNKISVDNGGKIIKPEDGNEFVKVDVTVENISSEEKTVSSILMFKVVDKDGRECKQAITENQNGQLDGKVAPGRKITGEYAVQAPKGEKGLELQFDSSLLSSGQIIVKLN